MAIVTITADLNGGDQVTPNADLTYKIYNGSDALIVSKGSANNDTDVSVNADVVTLINVDIGAETEIKITSTNQFGQESVLSDAFTFNPNEGYPALDDEVLNISLFNPDTTYLIREDGGDTTQLFTNEQLTNGTAEAFCGANNGFVEAINDTTNSLTASQSVLASQPQIIEAGVLLREFGKPVINFDGTDDFLRIDSFTLAQPFTILVSSRIERGAIVSSQGGSSDFNTYTGGDDQLVVQSDDAIVTTIKSIDNFESELITIIVNDDNSYVRFDSALDTTGDAGIGNINGLYIGLESRFNNRYLEGSFNELRILSGDKNSTINTIEREVGNYLYNLPSENMNIFLHGGQSNSEGRVDTTDPLTPSYIVNNVVEGIKHYNGNVVDDIFDLSVTSAGSSPPQRRVLGGNGRSFNDSPLGRSFENWAFADVAFKEINNIIGNVLICGLSKGGTSLTNNWINGQDYLGQLEDKYNKMITKFNNFGVNYTIRGLVWHQGEEDSLPGLPSQYQASWNTFISRLRTTIGDNNFPIFYGTIPTSSIVYDSVVETAQVNTASSDANLWCRDNSDLTLQNDDIHLNATSQITFGEWVKQTYIDNY